MRTTPARLRAAYVVLAAADAALAGRPHAHRLRALTKPLLMPALAGSVVLDDRARASPLRTSTLAAQAAGWVGDLALMGKGRGSFLAGTAAFAAGHAAYVTGFRRVGRPWGELTRAPVPRAVAGAWTLSGPAMAVAAARQDRRLGAAVLGYSTMLATMVATGNHLGTSVAAPSRALTGAGAGLFLVSDTLLGLREFVLEEDHPGLETLVMATYTAAQLFLAEGAVRA